MVGTNFVNAVSNLLCNVYANCRLHLTARGGAAIVGGGLGGYTATDEAWGKVIDVGVLQCGQHRTFVVPMRLPAALVHGDATVAYLEAHLIYHHSALPGPAGDDVEHRASAMGTTRTPTVDANAALFRSKLVTCGFHAVEKPGPTAQKNLRTLAKLMASGSTDLDKDNPARTAGGRIGLMRSDVSGRMTKALQGVSRFKRWGRHYLRAISRNHQLQLCANFMDPGLQVYGGELFRNLRDRGDKIFLGLPLPQPCTKQIATAQCTNSTGSARAPSTAPATSTYYAGSGGGCFGARSTVLVRLRDCKLRQTPVPRCDPAI